MYRQVQHKKHSLIQAQCPGYSQSLVTRSRLCQRFSPGCSQGPRSKQNIQEKKQRQSRQEVFVFYFLSKLFFRESQKTDVKIQSKQYDMLFLTGSRPKITKFSRRITAKADSFTFFLNHLVSAEGMEISKKKKKKVGHRHGPGDEKLNYQNANKSKRYKTQSL